MSYEDKIINSLIEEEVKTMNINTYAQSYVENNGW